jgi:hypothetical protein
VTTVKTCNANVNASNDETTTINLAWVDQIQDSTFALFDNLDRLVDKIKDISTSELSPQIVQKLLSIQTQLSQNTLSLHQRYTSKNQSQHYIDYHSFESTSIIKKEDYATHPLMSQLKSINILNHHNQSRPLQLKMKVLPIPNDIALFYYAQGLPPKDLTKYGIEPNPGPTYTISFRPTCVFCSPSWHDIKDKLKPFNIKVLRMKALFNHVVAHAPPEVITIVTYEHDHEIYVDQNYTSSFCNHAGYSDEIKHALLSQIQRPYITIIATFTLSLLFLTLPSSVKAFGQSTSIGSYSAQVLNPGFAPVGTQVMTQLWGPNYLTPDPVFAAQLLTLAQQGGTVSLTVSVSYTGFGYFDQALTGGIYQQPMCSIGLFPTLNCQALNNGNFPYSTYLAHLCNQQVFFGVGTLPPTAGLQTLITGSSSSYTIRLYAGDVYCSYTLGVTCTYAKAYDSAYTVAFYTIASTTTAAQAVSWASCNFNAVVTIDQPLQAITINGTYPTQLDVNVISSVLIPVSAPNALPVTVLSSVPLSVNVVNAPNVAIVGPVDAEIIYAVTLNTAIVGDVQVINGHGTTLAINAPSSIPVNVTNAIENVYLNISTLINNTANTPIEVTIPNLVFGTSLYNAQSISGYAWNLNQTVGPTPPPALPPQEEFAISRKKRNRQMHAENGNMSMSSSSSSFESSKTNNKKKRLVAKNDNVDFSSSDSDFEVKAKRPLASLAGDLIQQIRHQHQQGKISVFNFYSILYLSDHFSDTDIMTLTPELSTPETALENLSLVEKSASDFNSPSHSKAIQKGIAPSTVIPIRPGRNPNDKLPTLTRDAQVTNFFSKVRNAELFCHWLLLRKPRYRTASYLLSQSGITVNYTNPTTADIIISLYTDGILLLNTGVIDSATALAFIFTYVNINIDKPSLEAYFQHKFSSSISSVVGIVQRNHFRIVKPNNCSHERVQPRASDPQSSSSSLKQGVEPTTTLGLSVNKLMHMTNGNIASIFGMSHNKMMHMLNGNSSSSTSQYTEENPIGSGYQDNAEVEARPNIIDLPQTKIEEISSCPSVEKFVVRVNGSNPVYSPQNLTVPLSMSLNVSSIANTNQLLPIASFSPRESPFTLRGYGQTAGGVALQSIQRL